ncbi:MAG: DUF4939 domain-containing protein, partial [Plesiomonas sp.]
MDLTESAASLQKTLPPQDPAAFSQLTTEVSAQANVLAVHQHQLARLSAVTDELVKALQSLQVVTPEITPSVPPSGPVQPLSSSPPPVAASAHPRMALPEKYNGSPAGCKGFLLQCSLYIAQQPVQFLNDDSRIAFTCSLLTGKALDWATTVWSEGRSTFHSYREFLKRFREIFEHPEGGKEAGELLLELRQGKQTVAEYALTFCTLAAQTQWVDDTLKLLFRKGLNLELQSELACRDAGKDLSGFIELAIQVDNLICSRRPARGSVRIPMSSHAHATRPRSPESESMQLGYTHLSEEERSRRRHHQLCLYCGLAGHMRVSCPTRPKHQESAVSGSHSPLNIIIPATLLL